MQPHKAVIFVCLSTSNLLQPIIEISHHTEVPVWGYSLLLEKVAPFINFFWENPMAASI